MKRYLTEFIGTFFLVLTICLVSDVKSPGEVGVRTYSLAVAAILMAMVYMGGHISGGHYNPSVSLAVLLRGKLKPLDFVPYLIAQLGGALAAAYLVYVTRHQVTCPDPGANPAVTVILVEAIFTFALSLVFLNVATSKGTEGNSYYGLAIGLTYFAAASVGGPLSGGVFNPAVAVGPMAVHYWFASGPIEFLAYYLIGPFLGGAVAAVVFALQDASWGAGETGSSVVAGKDS